MSARGERLALRVVPAEWRDSVARDLDEEARRAGAPASSAWRILQILRIGARLRATRLVDGFVAPRTGAATARRAPVLRDFGRDLRLAIRGIVRRPGYAAAVIATLAVGIGANTAIYSVFNWILFRPLPGVHAPGELIAIRYLRPKTPARFFASYRDYADLRDGMPALAGLAASGPMAINLASGAGDPRRVDAEMVTTNYFAVLGVQPAPGRDFLPSDEWPGDGTPPAIISRGLWRELFEGDPSALGRTLTVNGHAFAIVGIAPAAFQGRSQQTSTDLWLPIGAHRLISPNLPADLLARRRGGLFADAIGRLKPGATIAQAQQQALAVAEAVPDFGARRPGSPAGTGLQPTVFEGFGLDMFARERMTTIFRLLMASVGLLLLLACANAANLLLARAAGRRREIAVCQAIGASRLRLVRQQLAEGLVLSLAAGLAGLFLAAGMTAIFDGLRILTYLPAIAGVGIDWRVCAFALLVATVTGVVFTLAPAVVSNRVDLQASLKDGLTTTRHGRRALGGLLVTIQVAVSVLLLVGAGLFVRTLGNLRALDLGFTLDGLVSFWVDPSKQGYPEARAQLYFKELLERLRAAPGIQGAAFSWTSPYAGARAEMSFTRADRPGKPYDAAANTISPGYFSTLGIRLMDGRDFSETEYLRDSSTNRVVIVSERIARELFPEGRAVGSRLILEEGKGEEVTIVGVAGNVRGRPLGADPEPWVYEPVGQRWKTTWGMVAVRSSLPAAQVASTIRAATRAIDPALPPYDLEPYGAAIDRALSEQRLFARLTGVFAAIAALLAAVGIYGMMAGAVSERRREFGIRLALGARGGRVLGLVVRSALTMTMCGLAAGLATAAIAKQAIASRLYGVTTFDPATLAGATALLVVLTLAASLVPAIRAARVDPVSSLRSD